MKHLLAKDQLKEFSIKPTVKSNKLHLMKTPKDSKFKSGKVKDLKNLAATLSQLYVVNQVRGGDTLEFFSHGDV